MTISKILLCQKKNSKTQLDVSYVRPKETLKKYTTFAQIRHKTGTLSYRWKDIQDTVKTVTRPFHLILNFPKKIPFSAISSQF